MKKSLLTTFIIIGSFCLSFAQKQAFLNFDYSLRIDFTFKGAKNLDTILLFDLLKCNSISQNPNTVIDELGYGVHRIEVYDSLTNQLIFSKGFSSLYEEWKNTPQAQSDTGIFEMSIFMPMPTNTIKVVFLNRNRDGQFYKKHQSYISLNKIKIKNIRKYETIPIHSSSDSKKSFDLVIIPDGYTKNEEQKLRNDLTRLAKYLLDCEPYSSMKNKINITGILVFSEESGITDPTSNLFVKTAVNSSFNALKSDRYLMINEVWKLNDIAQNAPFDAILVMCNTKKYGGGGIYNLYATTCVDCEDFAFVMTHELGHSINGLADEYYSSEVSVENYYPTNIEPWEPNITTLVAFEKKWKNMVDKETPIPTPVEGFRDKVGAFEGGGYQTEGVYRPVVSCSMKDIQYNHFCPVCSRAIRTMMSFYCK